MVEIIGRRDVDVEYEGKTFRVNSRHEERPGGGESRVISIFDSEGLYGFLEMESGSGLEDAEAYLQQPGKGGLQQVDPGEFEEIYAQLNDKEKSWDTELELENPGETAEPYRWDS
ncbi:MAG: hypothetical protein ACLFTA_02880 [Candidatus Nanohaloarchaea archaeon]